jgi:ATP-binding cassette subfamily F protein 3
LSQISLSFGDRVLLNDLSLTLGDGERVALVGPNGAGKTTLLRIALGEIEPGKGQVTRSRHVRTGYLPQEEIPLEGETALESALGAFEAALDAEREQAELQELIGGLSEGNPELPGLLKRLGDLQHIFEQADGYRMRAEAERVLAGLGLTPAQVHGPLSALSGGWRMRVALARLLLARPTHLFLDEPTNHLDIPSLAWLEEYLDEFSGTLVVISHDRTFLDRTVRQVYELEDGGLDSYAGNYSDFETERARRREALRAAQVNQAKRSEQLERFIERFRAKNTKARQVKSKEKLLARMERVEVKKEKRTIRFRFAPAPRSGRVMVELNGIDKSYGETTPVFRQLDLRIEREEKIALVGPNGAGKSTLLRILGGVEPIQRGERRLDERANVAIFAQHTTEGLNLAHTALEEVAEAAPQETPGRLRGLLGSFLFRGDDVFKPVRVLSGGEKARLAIAKTLLQSVNFLLLDEPTNHLDMAGKAVLLDALQHYDGTLVLVTHDRHLIDLVANRVIEVGMGGSVRDFPGNFSDYAYRLAREGRPLPGYQEDPARALADRTDGGQRAPGDGRRGARSERGGKGAKGAKTGGRPTRPGAQPTRPGAQPTKPGAARRAEARAERARATEERRLLSRIEKLEGTQAEIEGQLATPDVYTDGERSRELMHEFERLRAEVAALWDKLSGLDEPGGS